MTTVKFERYSPAYNADTNRCEWHWFDDEAPTPRAALESLRPGEWLRWDLDTECRHIASGNDPDGVYWSKTDDQCVLYHRRPSP